MDTAYLTEGEALAAIISFFMIYFFVFAIIGLIVYIFSSIALYTMAKKKGIANPWLAWIPVLSLFIFGKIIDEKVAFGSKVIPYAQVILPLSLVITFVLASVPYVGVLVGIVSGVYNFAAVYRLFKLYKPQSAVLFLILSIIFAIISGILMFVVRNNEPVEYLEDQAQPTE